MSQKTTGAGNDFAKSELEATADTATAALERAGDRATALVEAWIKSGNAAAVAEVAEHGDGKTRKAARRGLNVLRSRGIAMPEQRRVATVAGAPAQESFEAWLLAPDTAGNVLVVVTAHAPTTRYRAAFVFLHDAHGIHRVDSAVLSQSQLKDTMARVLPGAAYKAVPVPVEWARWRVAAARKRHAQSGVPEPLGLASAANLLEPVPAEAPSHPFDEEGLELALDDARELAKASQGLHTLPEFRHWFPTKAAVDELLSKLGEGLVPGQEPDADEMSNRLTQEIEAATDRYFTPERREDLVRAMRDSAFSVLAREGEQRALEVVAVMKVTENAGLITDPPRDIPFLKSFFEKAVGALLSQGGGRLRIPIARGEGAPDAAGASPGGA